MKESLMLFTSRRSGGRRLKDVLNSLASQCRTLHVAERLYLAGCSLSIFGRHRTLTGLGQRPNKAWIGSQVLLGPDQHGLDARTVVSDFRYPLSDDVAQAVWIGDTEANENDVGVGIRQRPAQQQDLLLLTHPTRFNIFIN